MPKPPTPISRDPRLPEWADPDRVFYIDEREMDYWCGTHIITYLRNYDGIWFDPDAPLADIDIEDFEIESDGVPMSDDEAS